MARKFIQNYHNLFHLFLLVYNLIHFIPFHYLNHKHLYINLFFYTIYVYFFFKNQTCFHLFLGPTQLFIFCYYLNHHHNQNLLRHLLRQNHHTHNYHYDLDVSCPPSTQPLHFHHQNFLFLIFF